MTPLERDVAGLRGFSGAKRKAVRLSPQELVTTGALRPEAALPMVIAPAVEGVDLVGWAAQNRAFIEARLLQEGGLLFRNFAGISALTLERFIAATSDGVMAYEDRSSPRSQVTRNLYTSTDHPADQHIALHNENSYSSTWPLKIFFLCVTPAERGGETPIADCRKLYERIDPRIRDRFVEKQVRYSRNFGGGCGLPWQTVFQTTDRDAVEAYCRRAGIDYEWKDDQRLRTHQVRPAVARHPRTGELLWFNQAVVFHVSALEPLVREELLSLFDVDDLPINACYGDGSPIEADVIHALAEAYRQETMSFAWHAGDILLLDNMLAAHGRAPFAGRRQIVVGMAEPCRWGDLQSA